MDSSYRSEKSQRLLRTRRNPPLTGQLLPEGGKMDLCLREPSRAITQAVGSSDSMAK